MDFTGLPQWMQDFWPWAVWIGGVGVAVTAAAAAVRSLLKPFRHEDDE
jgi:hypothetical protein